MSPHYPGQQENNWLSLKLSFLLSLCIRNSKGMNHQYTLFKSNILNLIALSLVRVNGNKQYLAYAYTEINVCIQHLSVIYAFVSNLSA